LKVPLAGAALAATWRSTGPFTPALSRSSVIAYTCDAGAPVTRTSYARVRRVGSYAKLPFAVAPPAFSAVMETEIAAGFGARPSTSGGVVLGGRRGCVDCS